MPSLEKLNGMICDVEADYLDCLLNQFKDFDVTDDGASRAAIGKLTALNTRIEVLKLLREVYYDE